ncbi:hypothetical protein [Leptolyngbya sp. BC1307]|uniref:hypothetical protein n=1 Tax=Leptolyngbya sp. BC1307 TaxID=2029589 RepID=UPI001F0A8F9B|nr:hypothetical protein [Leptolyngbya sp. BC1307]
MQWVDERSRYTAEVTCSVDIAMTAQLSPAELREADALLQTYEPAERAISTLLHKYDGDLEASLSVLVAAEAGTAVYGDAQRSLGQVFLKNLRREVCGDDSFRAKVEEYNKNLGKAALVTGLIVYLINLVTLPINPVIATIAVLWVLKLGLRTFCDYTGV